MIKVRSLSRRIEAAGFYSELIFVADDALDYLEEATFFATLIPTMRYAVKFLNTFRPDAELARRHAEIERLRRALRVMRDLLNEYDLRPRMAYEDTAHIAKVKEAVDEAIGD